MGLVVQKFGGTSVADPDRIREVASDKRLCVGVVGLQLGERLVVVDASEAEQRRDEVGVRRGDVEHAGAGG